jgi:hypothetical protein
MSNFTTILSNLKNYRKYEKNEAFHRHSRNDVAGGSCHCSWHQDGK